jgi:hypothetical protein
MILQYPILITEWKYYLDMLTDVQGYKFNLFKDKNNNFNPKNSIIYSFGYVIVCFFLYYFVIRERKSYWAGLIYLLPWYLMWDVGLFSCFDKAEKHIAVLLYDTCIAGLLNIFASQYIFYNYYNTLKNYIPLMFVLYILAMSWFYYENYKYNF